MKRAVKMPQYSDTKPFIPPSGVVKVRLDKVTNLLSNDTCPGGYDAAFLEGTAPTDTCDHATIDTRNLFQKIFGIGEAPKVLPPTQEGQPPQQQPMAQPQQFGAQPQQDEDAASDGDTTAQPRKRKGFFGRIFGSKDKQQPKPPDGRPSAPPQ